MLDKFKIDIVDNIMYCDNKIVHIDNISCVSSYITEDYEYMKDGNDNEYKHSYGTKICYKIFNKDGNTYCCFCVNISSNVGYEPSDKDMRIWQTYISSQLFPQTEKDKNIVLKD